MVDDGEIISMMVIIVFISCHETNNNDNNKVTVCVSLNSESLNVWFHALARVQL